MVGSTLITVQVKPEVLQGIRDADRGEPQALATLARELGITLRPMHPATDDPALSTYFIVDAENAASAERVAARLRDSPAVAAAYVKPPDAMP